MKRIISIVAFVMVYSGIHAMPGYLLLIGGGTEQNTPNSWNAEAYAWAVEKASNSQVAIVHYEEGSTWLEDYFTNQCGAAKAESIVIPSRQEADKQETYDRLTGYDMLFFRGGNQYKYYQFYKGTKTEEAIRKVFSDGGVLAGTSAGMAMLSGVMFTAENGTVYPEECIENPQTQYITLAKDFLNVFPGWVFDTHVAERGRMARSMGFMARWYLDREEHINAVSLDDMTALAIDSTMQATVYGTGAARIFLSQEHTTYRVSGNKLVAKNVKSHQLLQGWQYHFSTGEVTSDTDQELAISDRQEHGNFTILASGTNNRAYNDAMIEHFVNACGSPEDKVLLVKGYNAPDAEEYKAKLNTMEVPFETLQATVGNMSNPENSNKIKNAAKYLFVNNNPGSLLNFVSNSEAGQLLKERLQNQGRVSAFVGDDSRIAGNTVVSNYKKEGASYYHNLTFSKGLGLLDKTVIMPNTFYTDTTELYENTQTAIPWAIARDTLVNGIWLSRNNYMKYYTHGDSSFLKSYGKWPAIVMRSESGAYGFSEQTSYGYESDEPRMVAGLENYTLHVINSTDSLMLGSNLVSTGTSGRNYMRGNNLRIFPVPADETLHVHWHDKKFTARVYNSRGKTLIIRKNVDSALKIDTSAFYAGIYFIDFIAEHSQKHLQRKFVVY